MYNEPWFGAWPPEPCAGDNEPTRLRKRTKEDVGIVAVLVALAAIGGVLIWLSSQIVSAPSGQKILEAIGVALISTAALGLTIDLALKKRLSKDAVEAAFGYLLPPELRDQMQWLYGLRWMCTACAVRVELIPVQEHVVKVAIETTRILENITNRVQEIQPVTEVNENLWPQGRSAICGLRFREDRKEYEEISGPDIIAPKSGKATALSRSSKKIAVPPRGKVTIKTERQEYRHTTDVLHEVFLNATQGLKVTIIAPQGIGHDVAFGNDEQTRVYPDNKGGYDLDGLLLPYQQVEIRWWDRAQLERWINEREEVGSASATNEERV